MLDTTITLIGNLVENPVLRVTASGVSVCGFRVASTPRRFDRSEQRWVDGNTLYLRVSCWRQLAENVSASLSRGDRALVVGRLRQNNFETQDGDRRVTYEIDADAVAAELTWRPVTVQRVVRSAAPAGEVSAADESEHPGDPFGGDADGRDGGDRGAGGGDAGDFEAGGLLLVDAVPHPAVETAAGAGSRLTSAGAAPEDFTPVSGGIEAAGAPALGRSEAGALPASPFMASGRGGEFSTPASRVPTAPSASGRVTFGLADVVGEIRLLGMGGAFG